MFSRLDRIQVTRKGRAQVMTGVLEYTKNEHKIKCDCCGTETLAAIRDDKIIIMDKRHGKRHIAVLEINEILAIIQSSSL